MELIGLGSGIITIVIVGFSVLLTVAVTGVTIWFVWAKVLGPLMKQQQQQSRLLQSGQQAQGRVLSIAQTGMYVNNQPQVQIALEVMPPGAHPYQTQVTTVLNMLAIPRVQPGAFVMVRYDPMNPMLVAIEGI